MSQAYRYFVRAPEGRALFGSERPEAAETAALEYGAGAFVIDTLAQADMPMLQEVRDGALVISGYGGWDTGRIEPRNRLPIASSPLISAAKRAKGDRTAFQSRADLRNHAVERLQRGHSPPGPPGGGTVV